MSEDEGFEFEEAVRKSIGPDSRAGTARRLKAERRAGQTPKQRARRAKKTASLNFRCTDETRTLVEALRDKLDCDLSGVMDQAVRALADKYLEGATNGTDGE